MCVERERACVCAFVCTCVREREREREKRRKRERKKATERERETERDQMLLGSDYINSEMYQLTNSEHVPQNNVCERETEREIE